MQQSDPIREARAETRSAHATRTDDPSGSAVREFQRPGDHRERDDPEQDQRARSRSVPLLRPDMPRERGCALPLGCGGPQNAPYGAPARRTRLGLVEQFLALVPMAVRVPELGSRTPVRRHAVADWTVRRVRPIIRKEMVANGASVPSRWHGVTCVVTLGLPQG